jgi:hypothetical protein
LATEELFADPDPVRAAQRAMQAILGMGRRHREAAPPADGYQVN